MADFSIDGAKKERTRLMNEMAKIRQKIKAFDDFIGAIETSESTPTNTRVQDSTKARVKILIPECIKENGGRASKENIRQYLKRNSIKIGEGTLNVYMSKDDNIQYDSEEKSWIIK